MTVRTMNTPVFLGEDESGSQNNKPIFKTGLREGGKDAVATMTKYAVIGGVVLILGNMFVSRKTINRLQRKYL